MIYCYFLLLADFSFCSPADLLERGRSRENISSDLLLTLFLQVSGSKGMFYSSVSKTIVAFKQLSVGIQALHNIICQSLGWNRSPDAGILRSVQEAPLSS